MNTTIRSRSAWSKSDDGFLSQVRSSPLVPIHFAHHSEGATTWGPGRATIDRLLDADELQRVTPDVAAARRLVDSATRHLASAATVADNDPEAAFATSYDAARKACSALLEAQGLRATSRGGHIAVREAVSAQSGDLPGGSALRPFDRLRRRRNDIEYPSDPDPVDSEEVQDALTQARGMVEFADKLLDLLPVF